MNMDTGHLNTQTSWSSCHKPVYKEPESQQVHHSIFNFPTANTGSTVKMMIAQGLLVLCAVAYSQGFLFNPAPVQWVPVPIYKPAPKHIVKHVPIVKTIQEPVYIERTVRVPQYIERPIPVPYPVGGGVSQGGVSGGGAGASIGSFGLDAKIEDADTVNIVAGVSGFGSNNNDFNNNFNNNDDGFGRSLGGASFGQQQIQPRVSVSQTQISQPSVRVSQPQIGVHGGHGGHGGHGTKGFGHF